jgi:hypothetical protein
VLSGEISIHVYESRVANDSDNDRARLKFTLDLHEPGTHGLLRWTTKDSARCNIELTAVTWARDLSAIKLADLVKMAVRPGLTQARN